MVAELYDPEINKRKLVTVRTVDALEPIEGADLIELAVTEGWKVVVKKGDFAVGDHCVYFEIDSFLPDGVAAWQFLVDKSARLFEGVKGHKLRTIKLRGQISQGLILPLAAVSAVNETIDYRLTLDAEANVRAMDFADVLGIKKWEAALPAQLQGIAAGLYPSDIRKTDQERCQNLQAEIFGYGDRYVPFDTSKMSDEVITELIDKEVIEWIGDGLGGCFKKLLPAKADPNAEYEISMKLDGSSGTFFVRGEDGGSKVGVCSRNLELKISEENIGNTFVSTLLKLKLDIALHAYFAITGRAIAVQGEVMGPNIQGNREQLSSVEFYVFDVYDMDNGRYMSQDERADVLKLLKDEGAVDVKHVPILHPRIKLQDLGLRSIADLLAFAEGPSIKHAVREGLVFKRIDGRFSFKAISNTFLAKEKD